MSKSFTLSKMSLKDIVIAVLVLYITYKLVEYTGVEPVLPSSTLGRSPFSVRTYIPQIKMSSLMTCSGHDGRIVYGLIQVGDFISTSQIQLKYGSLMKSGAPGEPGCNKKSVHLSSRTGVSYIYLYQ